MNHILIHCHSESARQAAHAFLDGKIIYSPYIRQAVECPAHLRDRIKISKVAPRILRLDPTTNDDIDFAMLRQYLGGTLGLLHRWDEMREIEGQTDIVGCYNWR